MSRPSRPGRFVRACIRLAVSVEACLLFVAPAAAREAATSESDPLTLAALQDLRVPSEARVSPDSTVVLFRLLVPQKEGNGGRGEIWRAGPETDEAVRLLEGGCIGWSPSSDWFAYLATGESAGCGSQARTEAVRAG